MDEVLNTCFFYFDSRTQKHMHTHMYTNMHAAYMVFLILATVQYRRVCAHAKLQMGNLIHLSPNIPVSRYIVYFG